MVPRLQSHSLSLECFIFIVGAMAMIDKPGSRKAQWHHDLLHHHPGPWQHGDSFWQIKGSKIMEMSMVPRMQSHSLSLECFIFIVGAMTMIDKPGTRMAQWHHVLLNHHTGPWQH